MKKFLNIIKGAAVGLANVVAGLSGATIAVICRVYDDMIDVCTSIAKHPINTIKKHWMLLVGILIGILGGAIALKRLYAVAPLPVSLLFAGIVLASFIPLAKKTFKQKSMPYHYLAFFIAVAILVALPLITKNSDKTLNFNFKSMILLVSLGIISAASMIIPGVSGALVLAAMGYYEGVLTIVSNFFKFIKDKDMTNFGQNFVLLLSFGIGALIGLILCAHLIKMLLSKFKVTMDYIISGLVAGSLIAMVMVVLIDKDNRYLFNSTKGIVMWIIAILLFVLGLLFGLYLNRVGKKDNFMKFDDEFFNSNAKKYTKEWISITQKLVSYPSVLETFEPGSDAPFGQANKEALEWILAKGEEDGFKAYNCDNYAGHLEFGEGDETLGILAHLDVVPAVGNWKNDPFTATLYDNDTKMVGRGVNDDKGPLAAAYIALKILKDNGFKPNKKIKLIMGCDEESGSRCLEHYFKSNPMPEFGFSPDACFPCINGEKAGVSFDIVGNLKDSHITYMYAGERYNIVPDVCTMKLDADYKNEYLKFLEDNNFKGEVKGDEYIAYGVAAHAMIPQHGINATFILFKFVNEVCPCVLSNFMVKYMTDDPFGKKLGINVYHDEMKELTENVGIVRIENGSVRIGVDCRVPVDGHNVVMASKLEEALNGTGLTAKFNHVGTIHYVPRSSKLVSTLVDAYKSITNDNVNDAYTIGGGTYAKFIDNAVAFGPQFVGSEDVDHQTDEYILVSDYTKAIAIYAKAIYELVK